MIPVAFEAKREVKNIPYGKQAGPPFYKRPGLFHTGVVYSRRNADFDNAICTAL
jgi:hypothetical protein